MRSKNINIERIKHIMFTDSLSIANGNVNLETLDDRYINDDSLSKIGL